MNKLYKNIYLPILVLSCVSMFNGISNASGIQIPENDADKHLSTVVNGTQAIIVGVRKKTKRIVKGGEYNSDMKAAIIPDNELDGVISKVYPQSFSYRDLPLPSTVFPTVYDLLHYLNSNSLECYAESEAKIYSKKKTGKTPVMVTNNLYDCVGVVIDGPEYTGSMHVNFENFKKNSGKAFGRLERLIDRFINHSSEQDLKESCAYIMSPSCSILTEQVFCTLQSKGIKVAGAEIGQNIASRAAKMKVLPLSVMNEGTSLEALKKYSEYQSMPLNIRKIKFPFYSIFDIANRKFIYVNSNLLINNVKIGRLLDWFTQQYKNEEFKKAMPHIMSFFSFTEMESVQSKLPKALDVKSVMSHIESIATICTLIEQTPESLIKSSTQNALRVGKLLFE